MIIKTSVRLVSVVVIAAATASSTTLKDSTYLFQLSNSLSPFLGVLLLMALTVAALFRDWILGVATSLALVVLCLNFLPALLPTALSIEKANLRIVHVNLYHHNPEPSNSIEAILHHEPDVIALQELNLQWLVELEPILSLQYPFSVNLPSDTCCYGIGVYSKHPIISSQVASSQGIPYIKATISVRGESVTIISIHTLPPIFPNQIDERDIQLQEFAQIAKKVDGPLIVLGDFNVVHWDRVFQQFLKRSGLTKISNGLQPTFPMDFGLPLIPIDHVTYSEELVPTECETFSVPGSDHKGIIAGFAFTSR